RQRLKKEFTQASTDDEKGKSTCRQFLVLVSVIESMKSIAWHCMTSKGCNVQEGRGADEKLPTVS
ncbi:MAG: hypothetical protein GXP28_09150, partial [Planctomycetes bacterium]|nr:hypothetical protein [Planctomycetota bacterium]